MSDKVSLSCVTIRIGQIYGILNNLDDISIFLSAREVYKQLNAIIDNYISSISGKLYFYPTLRFVVFKISFNLTINYFSTYNL